MITGQDCMKKWGTIRDYYTRVRGKPAGTGSGSEFIRKRIEQLSFLDTISNAKRRFSNEYIILLQF